MKVGSPQMLFWFSKKPSIRNMLGMRQITASNILAANDESKRSLNEKKREKISVDRLISDIGLNEKRYEEEGGGAR